MGAHAKKASRLGRRGRPSKNLVAGLYQRGTTYWIKFYHEGQCIRQSLGTDDLSLAVQKAEIARRRPVVEGGGRWETEVKLYIAEGIHRGQLSLQYGQKRQYALLSEARRMGWVRPQQLLTPGSASLQAWYDGLRKSKSENTATGYLAHLRGFCSWLLERGKIRENPALVVKRAKGRAHPRKNFCSKETVRQLLDACVDPQLKFILYCGFHCGMRKGEIINAHPGWFVLGQNGEGRVDIRIRPRGTLYATDPGWKPKNRKERSLPLTSEFRAFLESGAVPLDKPFVVEPTKIRAGKSAYRYDFRKPFQDLLATCGIDVRSTRGGCLRWQQRHGGGCDRFSLALPRRSSGSSIRPPAWERMRGLVERTDHPRRCRPVGRRLRASLSYYGQIRGKTNLVRIKADPIRQHMMRATPGGRLKGHGLGRRAPRADCRSPFLGSAGRSSQPQVVELFS